MTLTKEQNQEFLRLFKIWKESKDPKIASKMLAVIWPVITAAVRTYVPIPSPTIYSKTKSLVLQYLDKYDPERGNVMNFLMFYLRNLSRFAAKEQQIISIPERMAVEVSRMNKVIEELTADLGREPTDAEIADKLGVSLKRLELLRKAQPGIASGMYLQQGEEEEKIREPATRPLQTSNETWIRFIYDDLDPLDKKIMEYSLGLFGRPILGKKEIARKLGIAPSTVVQRASRIQSLLDLKDKYNIQYI